MGGGEGGWIGAWMDGQMDGLHEVTIPTRSSQYPTNVYGYIHKGQADYLTGAHAGAVGLGTVV